MGREGKKGLEDICKQLKIIPENLVVPDPKEKQKNKYYSSHLDVIYGWISSTTHICINFGKESEMYYKLFIVVSIT